jgi:hypothetical protein
MHIPASARTALQSVDRDTAMPQLPMLAGDGPTLIHAAVAHNPAPQAAPANLEGMVVPVRDAGGVVKDWRLASDEQSRVREEFARWHDGFVTEAVVGDVATVRGLRGWARGRVNLSELGILQLPHARISPRHARKLAWQLRVAAEECGKERGIGIGVSATDQSGLARGFVAQEGPLMLLADGGAWIAASEAGLVVHADELPDTTLLVQGWTVREGNVIAHTDSGDVDLWTSRAGKLLVRVAPGLSDAVVRQVPLTTVFAGLFVTLADMALLASLGNTQLLVDRAGSLAA